MRKNYFTGLFFTLMILCLVPLTTKAENETGILHYWSFDGSAEDISKNSCPLAEPDCYAELVEGKIGRALDRDASDDIYTEEIQEVYQRFTVAAWIYPMEGFGEFRTILAKGSKTEGHFELYLHQDELKAYAPDLNNMVPFTGEEPIKIQDEVWTHVAAVYDGNSVTLYVNGEAKGTTLAAGELQEVWDDFYNFFAIGVLVDGTNPFSGLLDEVLVADFVLSDDQIAELAQSPEDGAATIKKLAGAAERTMSPEESLKPEPTLSPTPVNMVPSATPRPSATSGAAISSDPSTVIWCVVIVILFVLAAGVVFLLIRRKKK